MKVVYLSLTGNTRRFVNKLGMDSLEIDPMNPFVDIEGNFVIVAPTYDIEATECIDDFIEHGDNQSKLKGILGGGNLNFGDLFVFTAKDLAEKFGSELIYSFEYSGTENDVENIKQILEQIN